LKRLFVATRTPEQTRARLLDAAAALFAEQGFHGTTVREIAHRAGVNLAAGNYHFGSKRELYLEVLRGHFARVQRELRAHGGAPRPGELDRLDANGLRRMLHARIGVMLALIVGPPPGVYGRLMQREMTDPSEAMPVIVDEFIRPMTREMEDILARLAPDLERTTLRRCSFSIVGQVLFYLSAMPAVLRVLGTPRYTPRLTASLVDHVTAFSLGGLATVEPAARRRARAR
jgi:TetR/AcrR family transcriptional regulator, regulator of cefoperazone and chloramphenicol sensitivity